MIFFFYMNCFVNYINHCLYDGDPIASEQCFIYFFLTHSINIIRAVKSFLSTEHNLLLLVRITYLFLSTLHQGVDNLIHKKPKLT